MERPSMQVTGVVLDSPDAQELAAFYQRLLGWERKDDEPDWVTFRNPAGGPGLSFQTERLYSPPTWPSTEADQQLMVHLDILVEDLAAAAAYAVQVGARVSDYQPQEYVRVMLDPAGHPFCLYLPGA